MNITTTSQHRVHRTRKNRLLVVLLTVAMISSLLTACALFITKSNDPSPDGGAIHVKNEKELTNTINKAKNPTTITLDNDITLTKPLIISNNKNITLTSNTTPTDNNVFFKLVGAKDQTTITINLGGVLQLKGITVTHMDTYGLGVNVTKGGKLYMINGEISGNKGGVFRYDYGGGVAVYEDGFFEMTGGVICDNDGARYGGGVAVRGFFNMSGNAVIANNYAELGGGVVNVGSFIMSGNSIIVNNYAFCGGGVYNDWHGSFEMSGNSMITNNTASWGDVSEEDVAMGHVSKGGGVHNWGFFELCDDAVISGNVADHGGGVCIDSGGSFVMYGNGVIVNNTADRGGGVHNGEGWSSEECVFEMIGGKISDNFAKSDYGGVYSGGPFSRFSHLGGVISGNRTNGEHPNQ